MTQAYFPLFMGILVFMYLICSLRTIVVFFLIFLFLDIALFLLTGAYLKAAHGEIATYERLIVVSNNATLWCSEVLSS
jgi:succinate-acetate transporter protein